MVSPIDRARQASECRRHRDCARAHRLHVGDREGGAAHRVASSPRSGRAEAGPRCAAQSSTTLRGDASRPSSLDRGRRVTDHSTVVPNPRISAGSTVGLTGPVSAQPLRRRPLNRAARLTNRSHINVRHQPQQLAIARAAVGCMPSWTAFRCRIDSATARTPCGFRGSLRSQPLCATSVASPCARPMVAGRRCAWSPSSTSCRS